MQAPICAPEIGHAAFFSFARWFLSRRRRGAGSGLERSPAPRPRAGRWLAGACLLVALAVGVSEPAFAESYWLECPTTTVEEGESVEVRAAFQVGSNPGGWDDTDIAWGFWTQTGTADTSDYTHKNDVRLNVKYDSNHIDVYNTQRWGHHYATTEDTVWEGDETFTAQLTANAPLNGSRSDRCTITITDDDAPQFTAPTGTKVSNFSKSSDPWPASLGFSFDVAQGFTTGSNAKGYVLTQVDIGLRGGTGTRQFTVSIWSDATGNSNPGTKLGTLTNPSSQTGDWVAPFTTSTGIHLAANTKYWVVLDLTAHGTTTSHIVWTNSDEEDAGAEAGWSIADGGRSRAMTNTTWSTRTSSMQMAIHATDVPATATPPGAPGATTVQTGSTTSLQVAWRAPGNNGGYAILDYDVRYYAGSEDPAADADWIEEGETGGHTHTGTGTTATLAGLSEDTAYRVQVRARNVLGEGAWSTSDWAATGPPGAPGAPTVAAGAAQGSLRVAWSPPANDTRLAITDYDVRWKKPSQDDTQWTELDDTTAMPAPQTTTITGLTAGETYEVQVRAQNGAGAGAWSASTRGQTYGLGATRSLIGNLGQSGSLGNYADKDYRITFRTGSHAGGYTVTGLVLNLQGAAATTANIGLSLMVDAVPYPFTSSSGLVDGNNTFGAYGGGVDLKPDTAYKLNFIVWTQGNGLGSVALTPSASADADSEPGFSITASESRDGTATPWSTATNKLKFAIEGKALAILPTIDLVRVVSRPTHDADGDGTNDTYVAGDEILVDVEFAEAVKVDTQDDNANVALRVDVGGTTKKFALDRVLDGYETLRFAYTVEAGNGAACGDATTTADCDTDGIAPAPGTVDSVANTLVELSNGATVMGMDTGVAADLRHTGGFFQNGAEWLKVDGGMSAADSTAGPRVTAAEIPADSQGLTLKVTFDKALGPFDQKNAQLNLRVRASNVHSRQTQFQHPSHVARSTETEDATTRGVLTLTLGVPVRAGDRVSLGYGYSEEGGRAIKALKGTGAPPRPTPAFADFPVVNNLPGAPPIPTRADLAGTSLRIMFDKALDESAVPAGSAFRVDVFDRGGDYARNRTLWGTGTSIVTGSEVRVTLDAAARRDDIGSVFYAPAANGTNRLKGAGADGGFVNAIAQFHVSQLLDTTAPKLLSQAAGVFQSRANDPLGQGKSKIMLYFDERLDGTSVPAAGDFALSSTDSKAVQDAAVASVAVEDTAVVLTTSHWLKSNITYTVAYTPGTDAVMDPAGNAVAAFTEEFVDIGGGQPAMRGARVAGSTLELDMVQPLDPGSVPAPSAFALWETDLDTGETTLRKLSNHVVSVLLNNEKVLLRLYEPVYPCAGERVFRVSYTVPSTGKLQKPGGWGAESWTANKWKGQLLDFALAVNTRHGRCADWLAGTYMGSVILESRRAFARDRGAPQPAWFTVKASGGPVTVTGAAFATDEPKVLKLSLSREFAADETVTVSYRRPAGESGLWDVDGNQLKDVVDWPVARTEAGPPEVTGVALVSEAGDDATYALGETIRVRLTFSAAVDVDTSGGSPRLKIDMDPAHWGEQWAVYETGSGTDSLTFAYTVAQPNESTEGIAVLADTLALNGGAIRSAATETDAELGHAGLDHDPAHKVAWRQAPPAPAVTGVALASRPATGDTYGAGETLRVTLTFDEAVDVSGAPQLAIDMDPASWGTKQAAYEGGSGTDSLTFAYTVAQPNESAQGVAVTANTLALNGGTIRSAASAADADLAHAGLGHDPAHKVDWQQAPPDTTAPAVVSAEVDRTRATVTFDEDLAPIDADTLVYFWQVESPGVIQHPARMSVSGRTVTMHLTTAVGAGQRVAVVHEPSGIGDAAGNRVPYFNVVAQNLAVDRPAVTAVALASRPASGDTYASGETIRLTVTFDEAVDVTGTPRLKIDMDPAHWGEKAAAYDSGSGTQALAFAYTVVEPNVSTRGIALVANTLTLNGGAIRAAASQADANLAHAGLGHDPAHKVDWRPELSVADATAREGTDAAVGFEVSLSRAASGSVTVDYATADGTATAGEDYTAVSGTLAFTAGEQTKTIAVPLLDDVIDEGEETFTLRLSNAQGARITDGEATGTIENDDLMPKAWTARFGRVVASHLVDALDARLEQASSESYLQLGGHRLGGAPEVPEETARRLSPQLSLWDEAEAADPVGHSTTFKELLLASAFRLVSDDGDAAGGPRLSAWGRVATSGFDGREDTLTLDGTVTTATLGVDGMWNRWLTGVLLAYSEGDGSYSQADVGSGDVASSLTSVHPYVAYTLSNRLRLWGMVGYGSGALELRPADRRALDTDLSMTMGALGVRGRLLDPAQRSGLDLALRSDVLWMVMDSAAADSLAASEAEVGRLRLVLEGSRPVALAGGGSFTPALEVGLRVDGGDAETGTGLEVGGSLRYATPWGLSIEASVRGLLAHEDSDYREWGASGALRFDPGQQGKGLTASITPTWGSTASGMSRLWNPTGAQGLAAGDALAPAATSRLDAELGYGLVTLRGRGLLTPYARVALAESAHQAWHLGTRLALAESLNLSLEASRRAVEGQAAAHELALRANLGF